MNSFAVVGFFFVLATVCNAQTHYPDRLYPRRSSGGRLAEGLEWRDRLPSVPYVDAKIPLRRYRRQSGAGPQGSPSQGQQQGSHGSVGAKSVWERKRGQTVTAEASGTVWESRDGNRRIQVTGEYGRRYGGPRGGSRPTYGGQITYSGRF